jgi:hypothetical protein
MRIMERRIDDIREHIGNEEFTLLVENFISDKDWWDEYFSNNITLKQLWKTDKEKVIDSIDEDEHIELYSYIADELSKGNVKYYFYYDELLNEEVMKRFVVEITDKNEVEAFLKTAIKNKIALDMDELTSVMNPYMCQELI